MTRTIQFISVMCLVFIILLMCRLSINSVATVSPLVREAAARNLQANDTELPPVSPNYKEHFDRVNATCSSDEDRAKFALEAIKATEQKRRIDGLVAMCLLTRPVPEMQKLLAAYLNDPDHRIRRTAAVHANSYYDMLSDENRQTILKLAFADSLVRASVVFNCTKAADLSLHAIDRSPLVRSTVARRLGRLGAVAKGGLEDNGLELLGDLVGDGDISERSNAIEACYAQSSIGNSIHTIACTLSDYRGIVLLENLFASQTDIAKCQEFLIVDEPFDELLRFLFSKLILSLGATPVMREEYLDYLLPVNEEWRVGSRAAVILAVKGDASKRILVKNLLESRCDVNLKRQLRGLFERRQERNE